MLGARIGELEKAREQVAWHRLSSRRDARGRRKGGATRRDMKVGRDRHQEMLPQAECNIKMGRGGLITL